MSSGAGAGTEEQWAHSHIGVHYYQSSRRPPRTKADRKYDRTSVFRVAELRSSIALLCAVVRARRTRGHFPNDRAATNLFYLALRGVERKWRAPPTFWHAARIEFAIHFGERFAMVAS